MVDKLERFLQERIDNYRGLMDECVEAGTDENGYALAVEALQRVQQDAVRIATPTEDARKRVKVLEEALREIIDFAEVPNMSLSSDYYRGARMAWNVTAEIARTALGNKETDRHG